MELKQYFLGACIGILIFILAFTFSYIGTFTLLKVILVLYVLALIYFLIRYLSDTLSFHFEKRMFYRTTKKLNLWEGNKYKKILKFSDIVVVRILLVALFLLSFLLLEQYIVNLRIFFHEIGHLIVALSFNCQILEVSISVTGGYVRFIRPPSLMQTNLIIVSGTLWLVVVGMIFLIALHRDKKMPLTLNASLSIIIWIELFEDTRYWFLGSIRGIGDPYELINNNSGLDPFIVTYSSFIFLIFLCVFGFFSLGYKMCSQFKLVLGELIPDLTIFNSQEGRSFFTTKNHYEEGDRIN